MERAHVVADQDLAAFFVRNPLTEAGDGITPDLARRRVDANRYIDVLEAPSHEPSMMADGIGEEVPSGGVGEREHALGAVEDLEDGGDAEAVAEPAPDVRAQAVAVDRVHRVVFVAWGRWSGEKVTDGLAHVDEPGRA